MQKELLLLIQYLLLFGLGASLASFYNATIYRLEKEIKLPDFMTLGSFCEGCKRGLNLIDLIPVVGFFIRRGECPKCGHKVNRIYPVTELILGFSFIIFFYLDIEMKYYILLNFLFFLAIYDYIYKGFPKVIMHIFLLITGAIFLYEFFFRFNHELVVLAVSSSIILVIALLNLFKKSFGTGDLFVVLMVSFIVPLSQFISVILFSVVIAGVFAIFLLIAKKAKREDAIPFVPFIFIAYLITFPLQPYISQYFTSIIRLW